MMDPNHCPKYTTYLLQNDYNVVHTQPPKPGLLSMRRSKPDRIYEVAFVGYTSDRGQCSFKDVDEIRRLVHHLGASVRSKVLVLCLFSTLEPMSRTISCPGSPSRRSACVYQRGISRTVE